VYTTLLYIETNDEKNLIFFCLLSINFIYLLLLLTILLVKTFKSVETFFVYLFLKGISKHCFVPLLIRDENENTCFSSDTIVHLFAKLHGPHRGKKNVKIQICTSAFRHPFHSFGFSHFVHFIYSLGNRGVFGGLLAVNMFVGLSYTRQKEPTL